MSLLKHYKVYVIVVTYNGAPWVNKCLGSLRNSSYPVKTIVVDNQSFDDTTTIIEKDYPEIDLIKSPKNLGFGKGNNIAIAKSLKEGADYVFLLNQDAWIENETIERLVTVHAGNKAYGILSPLHYGGSGKSLDFAFNQYLFRKYGPHLDSIIQSRDNVVYDADFINAAAWMLSRECLEQVGGFGYLFAHYGEDRDYIQRLNYHRLKLGFISTTRIFHDREGKSFDLSKREKMVWYYYTGCITRLADINKSFTSGFFSVSFWCFRDCVYAFLRKRFFSIAAFFEIMKKVLKAKSDIIAYRTLIAKSDKFLFISNADLE
ncbi:MAG TPA: glycosyltransferase family 2 protein [Cyclobacteriaceae bacterium]